MSEPSVVYSFRPAREAIAEAFERIGGVDRLVDWIEADEANLKVFLGQLYPKLLSHDADPADFEALPTALTWLPPTHPPE
jgi:hypothetical protein